MNTRSRKHLVATDEKPSNVETDTDVAFLDKERLLESLQKHRSIPLTRGVVHFGMSQQKMNNYLEFRRQLMPESPLFALLNLGEFCGYVLRYRNVLEFLMPFDDKNDTDEPLWDELANPRKFTKGEFNRLHTAFENAEDTVEYHRLSYRCRRLTWDVFRRHVNFVRYFFHTYRKLSNTVEARMSAVLLYWKKRTKSGVQHPLTRNFIGNSGTIMESIRPTGIPFRRVHDMNYESLKELD